MTITTLHQGDNLQQAINQAAPGDTLLLDGGATFTGPFTLPAKDGTDWVTIASAQNFALVEGRRVTDADAVLMPKLVTNGRNQPALKTLPKAHNYRLVGIEFCPATPLTTYVANLVELGDGSPAQNSLDMVPHDLILDRCYIHAYDLQPAKRGIALNSGKTDILHCCVSNIKLVGQDCSAIGGWNGPGPYTILDCYLEASCENVLFGGANCAIEGVCPSDIIIRGCTMYKPLKWRWSSDPLHTEPHWSVKNIFEIKNARRVLLDGNILENAWVDGQPGIAVSLKCSDTGGKTLWVECSDIIFVNNQIRHVNQGFTVAGQTNPCRRIRIENNLITDLSGPNWGGGTNGGNLLQVSGVKESFIFRHNTSDGTTTPVKFVGPKGAADVEGFLFTDNVVPLLGYGFMATSSSPGMASLAANAPGAFVQRNYFYGGTGKLITAHPLGNTYDYPPGYSPVNMVQATLPPAPPTPVQPPVQPPEPPAQGAQPPVQQPPTDTTSAGQAGPPTPPDSGATPPSQPPVTTPPTDTGTAPSGTSAGQQGPPTPTPTTGTTV